MIRLEELTKVFDTPNGRVIAADRINMEVDEGQICVMLGPSGCGKTTVLKMINRLITPSSGKIFISGRDTDDYDPVELRRTIGYVIQQIGLFPNMTIEENICVVPRLLGWDMGKARKRAVELLEMVALEPALFLRRYPKELSGGQQQRVGVIRALAADPPLMLMDEPFGAIDPINREVIQDEFLKMQETLRKTIMFVSHDIDEAVKMGDKVAIFRNGTLEQFDTPDHILAHPANAFITEFVGGDRTLKRLHLLTVGQVMVVRIPRVTEDDTLDKATRLMQEHAIPAIVVVDRRDRPRGFVDRDMVGDRSGTVAEHVARLPATVDVTEDLRTAVSLMFAHGLSWLPCVDGEGALKGYITQQAITERLGETYRERDRAE